MIYLHILAFRTSHLSKWSLLSKNLKNATEFVKGRVSEWELSYWTSKKSDSLSSLYFLSKNDCMGRRSRAIACQSFLSYLLPPVGSIEQAFSPKFVGICRICLPNNQQVLVTKSLTLLLYVVKARQCNCRNRAQFLGTHIRFNKQYCTFEKQLCWAWQPSKTIPGSGALILS